MIGPSLISMERVAGLAMGRNPMVRVLEITVKRKRRNDLRSRHNGGRRRVEHALNPIVFHNSV